MLKVGDIFEAEDARWVVLEANQYEVRYDMTLYTETEYSYLAMKLSKTGKPLKSMWRFSTASGAAHKIPRNINTIGWAQVDYVVTNVKLDKQSEVV